MKKLILLAWGLAILSVGSSRAETIVALTSGNRLLFFDSATPGTITKAIDDWQSTQGADLTATGLAPTNNLESAILASLPAGSYTCVVSGKGAATGVAVVEIYQLP